jgi:hypothetical protein
MKQMKQMKIHVGADAKKFQKGSDPDPLVLTDEEMNSISEVLDEPHGFKGYD